MVEDKTKTPLGLRFEQLIHEKMYITGDIYFNGVGDRCGEECKDVAINFVKFFRVYKTMYEIDSQTDYNELFAIFLKDWYGKNEKLKYEFLVRKL